MKLLKMTALILTAALLFALCACTGDAGSSESTDTTATTVQSNTETTASTKATLPVNTETSALPDETVESGAMTPGTMTLDDGSSGSGASTEGGYSGIIMPGFDL